MPTVKTAVKPAPVTTANTLACSECKFPVASTVRKFAPTERMGTTFCCPKCAAISVVEQGQARMLRTHEWTAVVLEPYGFELLELRLTTAKILKLA